MSDTTNSNKTQANTENTVRELEQEVAYLRSLVNAYENLSIYKEMEIRDVQSTITAYEKLQKLQSKEKADADTTIDAFKQITEMTTEELKDSREMIEAYERLSQLHDKEVANARKTIDALEHVSELTRGELKHFHDRISNINRLDHPIQREMFEILDEDSDNEQHLLMKLNLLNLRKNDQNFYSHLFSVLVNLDFEEEEAKQYWEDILTLNREVSEKLGRKVSFRVSMLDYFIDLNKHIQNPKIIEFKFFESALTDAIFDKLTGLLNRSHLTIAVRSSIRNARRENKMVGLVMFDIDNFKKFNDFFGHPEGDTLLRSVGSILSRTFTGNNSVFRYGGEEFLAIVETTDESEIWNLAEKVRTEISQQWEKCILPVSVSGGYAIFPDDGDGLDELVSKADNALYEAKFSGKNRVLKYSSNRRQNTRLFTSCDVIFRFANDPAQHEYTGRTLDVSRGGLAIETEQPLSLGDPVDIFLADNTSTDKAKLSGSVCWVREKIGNSTTLCIAGIGVDDKQKSSDIYKNHIRPDTDREI